MIASLSMSVLAAPYVPTAASPSIAPRITMPILPPILANMAGKKNGIAFTTLSLPKRRSSLNFGTVKRVNR